MSGRRRLPVWRAGPCPTGLREGRCAPSAGRWAGAGFGPVCGQPAVRPGRGVDRPRTAPDCESGDGSGSGVPGPEGSDRADTGDPRSWALALVIRRPPNARPRWSNICSTCSVVVRDDAPDRPPGALPRGYAHSEHVEPRPVWVRLSAIYQASGDDVAPEPEADLVGMAGPAPLPADQRGRLDLTREVIGRLHHWERSPQGWFGVVDYSVPMIGDLRPAKPVVCGLVPAAALRPREPQVPDGQAHHAP